MNPIHATERYAGHHAEAAYSRWAPVYDLIFDLPFHPGRLAAARAAGSAAGPGGEILVIGVGTGLELPLLPGNVLVTGVDISAPMLRAAQARVRRRGLAQVKGLYVMDAADAPVSRLLLRRRARALCDERPAASRAGARRSVEGAAARRNSRRHEPFRRFGRLPRGGRAPDGAAATWLGWHPNFPYAAVGDWIAVSAGRAGGRTAPTSADEAVHPVADRKGRPALKAYGDRSRLYPGSQPTSYSSIE